jgi:uncharacterized membrane protein YbhN (UPF0104 family)
MVEMAEAEPQQTIEVGSAWSRRLGAGIGLALFAGLAWILASRWQELPAEVMSPAWPQLILAVVLMFVAQAGSGLLWGRVLAALGEKLSAVELLQIHFICQTGKYLPGKIMLMVGKAVLAVQQGRSRGVAGASVVYEMALFVISGGLAALLFAAFASADVVARHRPAVLVLCAVALAMLHPFVLQRFVTAVEKLTGSPLEGLVLPYRRLLSLLVIYVTPWLLGALAFFLFIDSLAPVELAQLPDLAAIFALSSLVGIVALFAPAGVGVREAAMSAMLSAYMPVAASIAVALAFRVALVTVDVIALLIALGLREPCRRRAEEPEAGAADRVIE